MADPVKSFEQQLAALRASYAAQLPSKLREILSVWDRLQRNPDDTESLRSVHRMAHTLAGSGATFGFDRISACACELECELKTLVENGVLAEIPGNAGVGRALAALADAASQDESTDIPLQAPALPRALADSVGGERRVFVVDADASCARDTALQLGHFGYVVQIFPQLSRVDAALAQSAPAAAIVDLTSAYDGSAGPSAVMEKARSWQVPLIFVSTETDFNTRLEAVRAGGVAYFSKPLDLGALVDRLDEVARKQVAEEFRVLIIDDSEETAAIHAAMLEQAGMRVRIVTDPTQVMAPLEEMVPDIILMDVYMPHCSGLELAAVLRQQDAFLSVPIVFLSTETDPSRQMSALGLGGDDFLTKPIDPGRLVSIVSARVARARAMRSYMVRDGLTGLLNHSAIKGALDREIASAERHKIPMAFGIIDVDHFKAVNDVHGHSTGDRVLKSLARLLQQRLRKTDYIGRYGGEEFAVILPGTNGTQAVSLMETVRAAFADLVHHREGEVFRCSFSGGIAVHVDGMDASALIDAADKALYEAKRRGRNRIVLNDAARPPA